MQEAFIASQRLAKQFYRSPVDDAIPAADDELAAAGKRAETAPDARAHLGEGVERVDALDDLERERIRERFELVEGGLTPDDRDAHRERLARAGAARRRATRAFTSS